MARSVDFWIIVKPVFTVSRARIDEAGQKIDIGLSGSSEFNVSF